MLTHSVKSDRKGKTYNLKAFDTRRLCKFNLLDWASTLRDGKGALDLRLWPNLKETYDLDRSVSLWALVAFHRPTRMSLTIVHHGIFWGSQS
jgi:hypothetical protein